MNTDFLRLGYDRPVMVTHWPAEIKAFYMQPAADDPSKVLCMDMLAPEGYGEIIGGSQRIHDHDLLLGRIREHGLPTEAFQWYLDVRKYGSVPHSGWAPRRSRDTSLRRHAENRCRRTTSPSRRFVS